MAVTNVPPPPPQPVQQVVLQFSGRLSASLIFTSHPGDHPLALTLDFVSYQPTSLAPPSAWLLASDPREDYRPIFVASLPRPTSSLFREQRNHLLFLFVIMTTIHRCIFSRFEELYIPRRVSSLCFLLLFFFFFLRNNS